ncbi:MAG TPA: glycosyltransferase family 2 protein [Pseudacidobacterium sp.]|jgi:glycosyltransferase involved in cell wall biosynthesis|nr:glycosyltransferase family 2 protein [Pseudacidobacterium sp.]
MVSHSPLSPRLSVVVPAYNEEATLRRVIEKLLRVPHLFEVIIVDDCSTDGTTEVASSIAAAHDSVVRVIRHKENSGKTEALKTGFAATTGNIVIVQDADLEYDPAEIMHVIDPIVRGSGDVVFGSRFQVRRAARVLYYYHYLANQGLTFLSNLLTNLNLTDVETGYKAFRGDIIRNMVITSSGFGFEIEVTAKIAKLKCAVYEVPISYYGRTYEEGKKIGTKDGIAALWYLVKYNILTGLRGSYVQVPQLAITGSVEPV